MKVPEEIFLACKKGDRYGQEQLYKLLHADLMRIALRYVFQDADALDVTNRGMFKVFVKIESFSGDHENFGGWIKKIIVNESLDYLRTKKRREAIRISDLNEENEPVSTIEEDPSYLLELLKRLPEKEAIVFNLFAMEGFSHQEISELLHISEANSKWLLFQARKFLREKFQLKEMI